MSTSDTDWERLRAMTDSDIDTSDIPQLGADFFEKAELRQPDGKVQVLLSLDEELAEVFRNLDGDFDMNVRNALREYAETHR